MTPRRENEPTPYTREQKLSGIGATEDEIDMRGTLPQRIDKHGTKVEDEAGTGEHDSSGG